MEAFRIFLPQYRYSVLAWGVLFACIQFLARPFSSSKLDLAVSTASFQAFLAGLACIALFEVVIRRLKSDQKRIGHMLRRMTEISRDVTIMMAGLMLVCLNAIALTFYAAAAQMPPADAMLVQLDTLLGFDWRATLMWFDAHPEIASTMEFFYTSSAWQLPLMALFFIVFRRMDRLREVTVIYAVCLLIVIAFAALFPAIGPFHYIGISQEFRDNLSSAAGIYHLETMQLIKSGQLPIFTLEHATGLVTFPSFHTVLAIVTIYAFRGIRVLFWPSLFLNIGVIVSTIPEGGHYLIDLVGGAAICLLVFSLLRKWQTETETVDQFEWRAIKPRFRAA
jgi:membrane-associated phospholipid phosphatase